MEQKKVEAGDVVEQTADGEFLFYCPGCRCCHYFVTPETKGRNNHPVWTFNGNKKSPTVTPSILVTLAPAKVCHFFIRDGHIDYCSDSFHGYAGQKFKMVDMLDW